MEEQINEDFAKVVIKRHIRKNGFMTDIKFMLSYVSKGEKKFGESIIKAYKVIEYPPEGIVIKFYNDRAEFVKEFIFKFKLEVE